MGVNRGAETAILNVGTLVGLRLAQPKQMGDDLLQGVGLEVESG